jgi:hypothetical protein
MNFNEATIDNEPLVPISDALNAEWMPKRKGKPPRYNTVRGWTITGVRGVLLEHRMMGSTPCISEGAFRRFTYCLSLPRPAQQATLPKDRQASIDRANAALDAAGI